MPQERRVPPTRLRAVKGAAGAGGSPDDSLRAEDQLPVLVCDDRLDVRQELSRVLQFDSSSPVKSVGTNDELLTACRPGSPDQVMIGVHPDSTFGADALDLLLRHRPTAIPVVYGSRRDIALLSDVYARGAAGLLLWEIDIPNRHRQSSALASRVLRRSNRLPGGH